MAELKVAFTKGVYRKDGYNQSHEFKKILYGIVFMYNFNMVGLCVQF